jgi:hypothetical protein
MTLIKLKNIFKNDVAKICTVVIVSLAAFIILGGMVLVGIKFFELGYVPALSPSFIISKPGSAESNLMLKLLNGTKNGQQTVNVYFGNEIKNPNAADCSLVYPVDRKVIASGSIEEIALAEMLKGPTNGEKTLGFYTTINPGVKINSLSIKDGIAHVDFDKKIEEAVGGSCRVSLIRSEITQTLLQFTNVKSVVIGVDGRIDDALQP